MQQLGKVLTQTKWNIASDTINRNSDTIYEAILQLENATVKHKGYFVSLEALKERYPHAEVGSVAFVYNETNDDSEPYDIYEYKDGDWHNTELNGGSVEVDIDGMQDKIYGYTGYHNGEYTEDATISTGEEGQTSHVKVDGQHHQIEMVVNKQDEEGQTTSASMNITEQGVSINGRLLVSDASETADIIAPDQMVLRVGNIGSEDAVVPHVSINSSLNQVNIGSNNDEASISVAEGKAEVVAKEIELLSENTEIGYVFIGTQEGAYIEMNGTKLEVCSGTAVEDVRNLIPITITEADVEAWKEAGLWDVFLKTNPLIYVIEE